MVKSFYSRFISSERYASTLLFCAIAGIYVVALLAVLGICLALGRDPISTIVIPPKNPTFHAVLAQNLLIYKAFTDTSPPPFIPMVVVTPGYPFFLAGLLFLARTPFAVPLVQIVLVGLTGVLIFKLGARLFSRGIGLVAALLYVLDPAVVLSSFQFMTETLFMFLFVLFLLLFSTNVMQSTKAWSLFILGVVLGAVILVRPIAQYLAPLAIVGLFLANKVEWKKASLYSSLAGFTLGVVLMVGPWMVRNLLVGGGFQLSFAGPYTLYHYGISQFRALKEGVPFEVMKQRSFEEIAGGRPLRGVPAMELKRRYETLSAKEIRKDPAGYLRFHLVKTLPFFTSSSWKVPLIYYRSYIVEDPLRPPNYTDLLLQGGWKRVFSAIVQHPTEWLFAVERLGRPLLLLLSLVPLWFERERRRILVMFLFGLVMYFAIATGPVSNPRYRLPAEPPLFLLGLWGIAFLAGKWRNRRRAWSGPHIVGGE